MFTETSDRLKSVWIVNHHAAIPSKDGSSGRHVGLARCLSEFGWEATLLVAGVDRRRNLRQVAWGGDVKVTDEDGVRTVWVPTNGYRSNGVDRIVSMVAFTVNALCRRTTRQLGEPDVVVGSTVHLGAAWAGLRLARRYKVPFVFEIRDVWPESLIDLGSLQQTSLVARAMRRFSSYLCKKAQLVVSPLPGVRSYLDDLGLRQKEFVWISNGVESNRQATVTDTNEDREPDTAKAFVLMYLGSHGHANGIDGLLRAFDRARAMRPDIRLRLRLIGDGSQKRRLQEMAKGLDCEEDVVFEDRVPRDMVLGLARQAHALIVNVEDLPVYRFGISLNKLFDYMLSGRPIVIANSASNNPVVEADAGISVPAGDVELLAEAICRMASESRGSRATMGENGRTHVQLEYSYPVLAEKLASALNCLVDSSGEDVV